MTGDRRKSIIDLMYTEGRPPLPVDLARVCAATTGATGAGLMLMSGDDPQGSVASTDEVSASIEELQFTLGEGPCLDAHRLGRPVLEPDLASPSEIRWVAFTEGALAVGACAIFGFPLQVGAVRLGALNLYRDRPGPLTADQHADAIAAAGLTAQALLTIQAGAPPGTVAPELDRDADFQYVVHQAAGMVAAQLEVSVAHALVRLRAHAFGSGRALRDVAKDVVERRLRFPIDPGGSEG